MIEQLIPVLALAVGFGGGLLTKGIHVNSNRTETIKHEGTEKAEGFIAQPTQYNLPPGVDDYLKEIENQLNGGN